MSEIVWESVAVGYMEVVGEGFTVAVEGIDAGACVSHCVTWEGVVVSVGQMGDVEGVGDGGFVRCDAHRYGTEGGGWWRVGRRRRRSEAWVNRSDVGVVVDVGVGATTAVEGVGAMHCARSARRHRSGNGVVGCGFAADIVSGVVGACMGFSGLGGCWNGVGCCRRGNTSGD